MKLLFFMPVGPRARLEFVLDTLTSCRYHYPSCGLLLLDDTGELHLREIISQTFSDITIYLLKSQPNLDKAYNSKGLLWAKTSECWLWAIQHLDFDFLIRIDDDSLIIKPGLEQELYSASSNIKTGALGQFRLMPDGKAVNNSWPRQRFELEMNWAWVVQSRPRKQILARLRWMITLRFLVYFAHLNDWALGEHITGGCIVLPRRTLAVFKRKHYLQLGAKMLRTSELGDDHLISMLVYAAGMKCCCIGSPTGSVGYRIDRLPVPLHDVPHSTFKIIHSVRTDGIYKERYIRVFLEKATRKTS